MKSRQLLLLAILIAALSCATIVDAKPIVPVAGISLPLASAGDEWNNGLAVGLQFPLKNTRHGEWSVVTSYQQLSPNAAEMLKIGGRTMKVESSEGVSRRFELGIIGDRKIWSTDKFDLALGIQYGAGVFLLSDEKLHIKASYLTESAALTREIFRDAETVAVPGLSLGCQLNITGTAMLNLRLHHLFTADSNRDFLFMGIGFLPY